MRVSELLLYFFGVCLAFTYGFELFLWSFILVILILLTAFIGALIEGIRFFQWVFLVGFTGQIVLVVMDVYSIIALVIYCLFLGFAIIATLVYGWGDFSKLKMRGPYQVGHKEFHSSKDGVAISVYYPMDKDTYKKEISESGRNSFYLRYGYKSRLGLAKITAPWGTEDYSHPFFLKWLDDIKMDIV